MNQQRYLPTDAMREAYHDDQIINAVLSIRGALRRLGCPVQMTIDDESFSIAGTEAPRADYPESV